MTDTANTPNADNSLATPAGHDLLLQAWVRLVNETKLEFEIVLQMSGVIVQGVLVAQSEYFASFSEQLSAGVPPDATELLQTFKHIAELGSISTRTRPTSYIHLRNAQIFSPDGSYVDQSKPLFWRGRISTVDAWWFVDPAPSGQ